VTDSNPQNSSSWRSVGIFAIAIVALASGFGQFGVVSALGDVAKSFGHIKTQGTTLADEAGLSGTLLGIGLAILRLSSMLGMPLASLADRFGRRIILIVTCAIGLCLTVLAAFSPSYWYFVAIFALGRPFLSATNAIAQVGAAEETDSHNRAKAVALVVAGYGIGAGLTAVINGLAEKVLGFRGLFALAFVPFLLVIFIAPKVPETRLFMHEAEEQRTRPKFASVPKGLGKRLLLVNVIVWGVSIVTGPANSFVFLYAQNILKISGKITALMVVIAGLTGLLGLIIGRYLADRFGRRQASYLAMTGVILTALLTYSGGKIGLFVGYELEIFATAAFGPAGGAFSNELFPTSARAAVAGWSIIASVLGAVMGLLLFGALADVGGKFSLGAELTFLPMLLVALLLFFLPETKGRELIELWPDIKEASLEVS
jgi:MFS family permease